MVKDKEICDLITSTLYKYRKDKFVNISAELQDFHVMKRLLTKDGGMVEKAGGIGVEETLMTNDGGYSRWVGLYEEDVVTFGDYLKKIRVDWCHLTDNMTYERREILENKGESRITNVIKPRKVAMMQRFAKTLEHAFFSMPNVDSEEVMWGLYYWLVANDEQGFNGGYAPGFDRIANINLAQVPTFKNWTDKYKTVSKQDLIKKLRKAHRKTHWVSPVLGKEFRSETGQKRKLFVNEQTISDMEDVGEAQNENLGRDLAEFDDTMCFKKHPLVYVPKMDSDTRNPIAMVDMDTFKIMVLKGDNLRMSDTERAPKQHNVFVSHCDLTVQTLCTNRRANSLIVLDN